MSRKDPRLGWIPDLPDRRDHFYSAPLSTSASLPRQANLIPKCPPVYDQGQIGSCTGNAIAAAIEFERCKQGLSDFTPSRLFIYYNERAMEGDVNSDAGAQIRDGIKSVATLGAPPETEWPYDGNPPDSNAKIFVKPSPKCYTDAKKDLVGTYQRVIQNLQQMRGCLASGYPFVLGFTCYQSLQSDAVAKTGDVPMPGDGESVIGGHAVLAVGYDDPTQRFIFRNSWGIGWGNKGYGTLPYAYLTDSSLSQDFWTVRSIQK